MKSWFYKLSLFSIALVSAPLIPTNSYAARPTYRPPPAPECSCAEYSLFMEVPTAIDSFLKASSGFAYALPYMDLAFPSEDDPFTPEIEGSNCNKRTVSYTYKINHSSQSAGYDSGSAVVEYSVNGNVTVNYSCFDRTPPPSYAGHNPEKVYSWEIRKITGSYVYFGESDAGFTGDERWSLTYLRNPLTTLNNETHFSDNRSESMSLIAEWKAHEDDMPNETINRKIRTVKSLSGTDPSGTTSTDYNKDQHISFEIIAPFVPENRAIYKESSCLRTTPTEDWHIRARTDDYEGSNYHWGESYKGTHPANSYANRRSVLIQTSDILEDRYHTDNNGNEYYWRNHRDHPEYLVAMQREISTSCLK